TDQCLVEGTQVTMGDGSTMPIEAIRVGDLVRSHDGAGFRSARVSRIYSGNAHQLVRIELASGNALVSTPEHVHFAARSLVGSRVGAGAPVCDPTGPWRPADAVDVGMSMLTESGAHDHVTGVVFVEADRRVHDLEVEGTHNFVANGIVTHNSIYKFRGAD